MIHWLWLIPAVSLGAAFGVITMALCVVANDSSDE